MSTPPVAEEEVDEELHWLHLTEAAASQLESGELLTALATWQSTNAVAETFASTDPRRAASLNNLGVGMWMVSDRGNAAQTYQQALKAWEAAADWVAGMQLRSRARSSLFHLRLEARHRAIYDRRGRAEYREFLHAGRAVSLKNLAEILRTGSGTSECEHLYRHAADERGKLNDTVDLVADAIATHVARLGAAEGAEIRPHTTLGVRRFGELAQRNGWLIDRPATFTDEGRLMAAVICTVAVEKAAGDRIAPQDRSG